VGLTGAVGAAQKPRVVTSPWSEVRKISVYRRNKISSRFESSLFIMVMITVALPLYMQYEKISQYQNSNNQKV
jgi:hypothetical protein